MLEQPARPATRTATSLEPPGAPSADTVVLHAWIGKIPHGSLNYKSIRWKSDYSTQVWFPNDSARKTFKTSKTRVCCGHPMRPASPQCPWSLLTDPRRPSADTVICYVWIAKIPPGSLNCNSIGGKNEWSRSGIKRKCLTNLTSTIHVRCEQPARPAESTAASLEPPEASSADPMFPSLWIAKLHCSRDEPQSGMS